MCKLKCLQIQGSIISSLAAHCRSPPKLKGKLWLTCFIIKASFVKNPREKLETNDGVDEDDKHDEEGDVKEGNHCHDDTVEHHLQT